MIFNVCTELHADPRLSTRLAVDRSKTWEPGQVLNVAFLDGTVRQQGRVVVHAFEWMKYANIYFEFFHDPETKPKCDIRITFRRGKGSWSYVGKDARVQTNQLAPTMNFGWLYDETEEDEYRRVVLHEFGHALGAIHEHQSPAAGIKWDKALLYQYYWDTQRWSKEQVNDNIIKKYKGKVSNTEFDECSIMLYPIDQQFTLDDYEVGWNTFLSEIDKSFIAEMYPREVNC